MAFKQYNFIRNSASFQSRCWSIYGRTCIIFEMNKRVPLPVSARLSLRMKALCYCSVYQSVLFLAVFICSISRALMGVCMCVCAQIFLTSLDNLWCVFMCACVGMFVCVCVCACACVCVHAPKCGHPEGDR